MPIEPMTSNPLRLTLDGATENDGHVSLEVFAKEIELLASSLIRADKALSSSRKRRMNFRVTGLHHSSPAVVEVGETLRDFFDSNPLSVTESWVGLANTLTTREDPPTWASPEILLDMRAMATIAAKERVREARVAINGLDVLLTSAIVARVDELLSPARKYLSSIRGRLEMINIHSANYCHVYPNVGPKKVKCIFGDDRRQDVIAAIGRRVVVEGQVSIRKNDKWPSEMHLAKIRILPADETLPDLMSLRGIAGPIGPKSSEQIVRELRDEWEN